MVDFLTTEDGKMNPILVFYLLLRVFVKNDVETMMDYLQKYLILVGHLPKMVHMI